jgi:hypothetical protein
MQIVFGFRDEDEIDHVRVEGDMLFEILCASFGGSFLSVAVTSEGKRTYPGSIRSSISMHDEPPLCEYARPTRVRSDYFGSDVYPYARSVPPLSYPSTPCRINLGRHINDGKQHPTHVRARAAEIQRLQAASASVARVRGYLHDFVTRRKTSGPALH